MLNPDELLRQAAEHLDAMKVPEALEFFERAEQASCSADECAGGRWACHMLSGNFEQAWCESDSIARRGNPDPFRYWSGSPLAGRRVLVRCLHGLGDTIQFIRYAPLLRRTAQRVIVEAQPSLKRLIASSGVADEVITWGDREPAWDEQVEVIELPRIFRTELHSIPNEVPYLSSPPREPQQEEARSSAGLRVGVVWNSSAYNPSRSIPFETFAGLFDVPGTRFFSLQAGPARFDLKLSDRLITDLYREEWDVLDAAEALRSIDLVISVDTMMAHLAGALAVPVWTLLPYQCDWRWMLDRSDSPWYPTMRLLRQTSRDEWRSVIDNARRDLKAVVR